MTLLPSDNFNVRGVEGPRYETNEICCVPGCHKRSVHGHHMWPRSFLRSQPQDWVEIVAHTVTYTIANKVGMCVEHHDNVTGAIGGHKARIVFKAGIFWWVWLVDPHPVPLAFQPQGVSRDAQAAAAETRDVPAPEICPECGKPKHERKHKPGKPRETKDWVLAVPNDAEIGADVLDGWADDFAIVLGFGDAPSRLKRYHAVATVLAWASQHREDFVADLIEATNA